VPVAGWLQDVPCRVEVLLGTAQVTVRDCLQLERDVVIRLREGAGADLEVRAEGIPIAMGEVVVVDDQTALRVNRILPAARGPA
jgi:flagellar motor switch protein FliN/FliY